MTMRAGGGPERGLSSPRHVLLCAVGAALPLPAPLLPSDAVGVYWGFKVCIDALRGVSFGGP